MSETLLEVYHPTFWMQQNTNYPPRMFSDLSDAYGYDSATQNLPGWLPCQQQESHSPVTHNINNRQHQRIKNSRRAMSQSHATLYESRPHYSHSTGGNNPQYSPAFDHTNPAADQTSENSFHSPTSFAKQHLPTPSHTPTQDSFLLDRAAFKNRSKSAAQPDLSVAAYRAMRNSPYDEQSAIDSLDMPAVRSPGLSVSSYGQDLPTTPRTVNGDSLDDPYQATSTGEAYTFFSPQDDFDSYRSDDSTAMRFVPKFSRTISDIYQDELYTPASVTSAPAPLYAESVQQHQAPQQQQHQPQPKQGSLLSPHRNMINDRLQAANEARSSISPSMGRVSPFRQGSPFAATQQNGCYAKQSLGVQMPANGGYQQYTQKASPSQESQATISPKDAVLDFNEPNMDEQSTSSLFPENSNDSENQGFVSSGMRSYGPLPLQGQFTFQAPAMPQHHDFNGTKFQPPHYQAQQSSQSSQDQQMDYPARLISMETTKSEGEAEQSASPPAALPHHYGSQQIRRPADTTADRGTYTCTYHGCVQRFATPALLQKHKKDGHRSQHHAKSPSKSASPDADADVADLANKNSQAGPHRCDRINPSTGKPCNAIFSRPYDLTRHEDTIHAQRTKVRCEYCTEEKTFSRSDALTRHMRVVHPQVDFQTKQRKKHHA